MYCIKPASGLVWLRIEQLVAYIVFFPLTGCLQLFVEKQREHLAHPYKCCKERLGLEIPTLCQSQLYTAAKTQML